MNLFNYLREYQQQWGEPDARYQAIEQLIDHLLKQVQVDEIQPKMEAQRLVQLFQNYSIDIDNKARYQYSIFSAIQHVTDNTTPLLSPEQIIFNMAVVAELERKLKTENI
jgi:hypothetical protein